MYFPISLQIEKRSLCISKALSLSLSLSLSLERSRKRTRRRRPFSEKKSKAKRSNKSTMASTGRHNTIYCQFEVTPPSGEVTIGELKLWINENFGIPIGIMSLHHRLHLYALPDDQSLRQLRIPRNDTIVMIFNVALMPFRVRVRSPESVGNYGDFDQMFDGQNHPQQGQYNQGDNNFLGDLQFLEEFNLPDGNELDAYMDFIGVDNHDTALDNNVQQPALNVANDTEQQHATEITLNIVSEGDESTSHIPINGQYTVGMLKEICLNINGGGSGGRPRLIFNNEELEDDNQVLMFLPMMTNNSIIYLRFVD